MVTRIQFISLENSFCPKSTVYVPRVQFMYPQLQFMSQECSLFPQSTVYVLRLQFMIPEYSLCPKNTVY